MFYTIISYVAIAASIGMCGAIGYFMLSGRHDREDEEAARDFFTLHGHWPDEEPEPSPPGDWAPRA